MSSDPELVAETKGWLGKAREDLAVAHHDLAASMPFLAAALFHVRQAVEKMFKGFLSWHATPFRKTHSLEELGEQCLRLDDSLRPIVDSAAPLTQYAWKFRYPGEPAGPTREEAERALAVARGAYEAGHGAPARGRCSRERRSLPEGSEVGQTRSCGRSRR